MTKLTLKELAEYWLHAGDYMKIVPNAPDNAVITSRQANELGEDILSLFNRIERLESIVLKNNNC